MKIQVFFLLIAISSLLASCHLRPPSSTKLTPSTTFILVRHAEKVKNTKNPSLTPEGEQRAKRLKKMLAAIDITTIYTTDYNRTSQTVRPIAEALQLSPQIYEAHDKTFLDTLQKEHTGEVILIAGHSNTIPKMVNHLIKKEKYQDLKESDYNNIFIVVQAVGQTSTVLNLKF